MGLDPTACCTCRGEGFEGTRPSRSEDGFDGVMVLMVLIGQSDGWRQRTGSRGNVHGARAVPERDETPNSTPGRLDSD